MCTCQREYDVVIETGRRPAIGGMAGPTACSELAGMRIIFRMTGITTGGGSLEHIIDMAVGAWNCGMFPNQLETR